MKTLVVLYSRSLGGEKIVLYGAVRSAIENVVRAGGEPPKEYRVQQCSSSTRQTLVSQRPRGRAILTSSAVQSATTLDTREKRRKRFLSEIEWKIRKQAKLLFLAKIVLSPLR